MLRLKNITKDYDTGTLKVEALKKVNIDFRKSEFVSILGPSGCGKTTLLNIVGGLDRYTDGDLIINGRSTKEFKDHDWDTYRNHSIGFVFQSYNLIPHQTVLGNVELALSIGGVPKAERRQRAIDALEKVGLKNQLHKKPNQMSGGQMQRVSIARALVNNPDIILADEPTGALDSETSVQVMEILKEIAKDRLVIMVTHNPELANRYSTRIINILDGKIIGDTNPVTESEISILEEEEKSRIEEENKIDKKTKRRLEKKTSMSFLSALRLSLNNLLSKKKRTFITCLAGSIGIIGIATILAVASGMDNYVAEVQEDSSSMNYIMIQENYMDYTAMMEQGPMMPGTTEKVDLEKYPDKSIGVIPYKPDEAFKIVQQKFSKEYLDYIEEKTEGLVLGIKYTRSLELNAITKIGDTYKTISTEKSNFQEMLVVNDYLTEQYEILSGNKLPTEKNEIAIVVDEYNRISVDILSALSIDYDADNFAKLDYDTFLNKEIKLVLNNGFYEEHNGRFSAIAGEEKLKNAYNDEENTVDLKVVSVVRLSKDSSETWSLPGVIHTRDLTEYVFENSINSDIGVAQLASTDIDVITGRKFNDSLVINPGMGAMPGLYKEDQEAALRKLGASRVPTEIVIRPKDFDSKRAIMKSLDSWNEVKDDAEDVQYMDVSNMVIQMLDSTIDIVSYVLIAFSSISLIVSSIMIAIIIYASVIERIKEIGVLRSVGARKKDISRVFKSEAVILGFVSGVIAIVVTGLICLIINIILNNLVNINTIGNLTFGIAFSMIILNVILTLIASLVPAKLAAKKDPVLALRSE